MFLANSESLILAHLVLLSGEYYLYQELSGSKEMICQLYFRSTSGVVYEDK